MPERGIMSFSAVNVSNNLLFRAFEQDVNISPMKLQKLLYFVASEYAKATNTPLLNEQFRAWQYGPVVRSVYDEFKSYGGAPIRKYAKDAEGKAYRIDEGKNMPLAHAIDRVWGQAKGISAVELSRITHTPGSAWFETYQAAGSELIPDAKLAADETYRKRLSLA